MLLESELQKEKPEKFVDPYTTAKGEKRAWVAPFELRTLWINTGTLCNLECANCYIESSPKNDRLVYISEAEVVGLLDEIRDENYPTKEIAFTGGEPFLNKEMVPILDACLSRGLEVLVLTNAMKPMMNRADRLVALKNEYGVKLKIRVSLDHYTEVLHAQERGPKAWEPAIKGIQWLSRNGFHLSIAGRTFWSESEAQLRKGFGQMLAGFGVELNEEDPESLVLFPEMDENVEVPEITTKCWNILNADPKDMMCATSRMVVKHKGDDKLSVMACTLLPYDKRFNLGSTLKESWQPVSLNHPHCAKFCVLGGGSCSKA